MAWKLEVVPGMKPGFIDSYVKFCNKKLSNVKKKSFFGGGGSFLGRLMLLL
ncbi:hypothetical protein ARTHRO_11334 [Limnospira indica PCC 8005]|uniref:Uncharacterized protein n=1 Tax=Limnospira indica PCC 8005 TaxID=376219 RepID=A0A9P1NZG5_9CYAN|nr:hypothetical protein ARTHRO_11334 [Limnospira indica PCC 8005]